MARKAKRRARSRKVARRGMGWLWPAQRCGLSYDKFRSGTTFAEAYEWLAYRKNEQGQSFRPSKKRIIGAMAQIKRSMYEEYKKACTREEQGGPKGKTWADCRRVCKMKSRPCGKACVSKKKNCKKPPAADVCAITDFQVDLDFAPAAADAWEEQRAQGGALPDAGDTSFDFVLETPAMVIPSGDDDFGYEPPPKYGFKGLRGGLRAGRGGAAANRGKYKPLPPGTSAIDQHRALEQAREDIIRAVESGRFELCEKGRAAPSSKQAPMTVAQTQQHGQRTTAEIDAIRRRFERAGY